MPKPRLRNHLGFKYRVGQHVTHERDRADRLPPASSEAAPRYTVVSQLLETGPDGPQRFYYLSRAEPRRPEHPAQHIRAAETQLAPFPNNAA